jgi:hypothetical protein
MSVGFCYSARHSQLRTSGSYGVQLPINDPSCICTHQSCLLIGSCSPVCVSIVLTLSCRDLDRPADFGLISRLGRRAAVVCAPDDMWFPQQHYQLMRSALPGMEVSSRRCCSNCCGMTCVLM